MAVTAEDILTRLQASISRPLDVGADAVNVGTVKTWPISKIGSALTETSGLPT